MKEPEVIPGSYGAILPDEWNIKFLDPADGITRMVTDGSHYSPPQISIGQYVYATVSNLSPNGIDYNSCNRLTKSEFDKMVRWGCKPSKGDVLFSKDGTVGITAVFEDEKEVVLLSSIAIIRPEITELDSRYLKQFLSSELLHNQMRAFVSGTALHRVVLRDIKRFRIPLPPLHEQRHIAEVLDTLDKAITQTEQLIEKLKAIKSGLLHDLLTKGIGENGRLRDPKKNPQEFKETGIGRLPLNWRSKCISEVANVYSGGTPSRANPNFYGGNIPWLKSAEVTSGYVDDTGETITEAGLSGSSATWVPENSVLIAMYGATAGAVAYLRKRVTINQAIAAIVPNPHVASNLFLYFMLAYSSSKLLTMVQGSGQPNLNQGMIKSLKIPIPPIHEQKAIETILSASDVRVESELKYLSKLKNIKCGLMNDLLTGQVRVKNERNNGGTG